jgi:hypothetical protein
MEKNAETATEKAAPQQDWAAAPAEKTVLINEGVAIKDMDTLRFVVKSLLQKPKLDPEDEADLKAIFADPANLAGYDTVARAFRAALERRNQDVPGSMEKILAGISLLAKHELSTVSNRLSFLPKFKENPNAVFWPDPTHPKYPRSIFGEKAYARHFKFITPETPIGSAGSCFALRIAERLQSQGFNYVVSEPNLNKASGFHMSCARWGTIFNVPSFRQLVERAFGLRAMPKVIWTELGEANPQICDPFREDVRFDSIEDYERDIPIHTAAIRAALTKCKVFVMTLGMNEVWYLKAGNLALARSNHSISGALVKKRVLTVEENLYELQRMLDIWRAHNPDLKIIVSTSPVPLSATFRANDYHVIAANCHSKSTLRLVAEAFAERNRDVYYFPAYETVLYGSKNAWEEDQRHVSNEAVGNVMALFDEMFVVGK